MRNRVWYRTDADVALAVYTDTRGRPKDVATSDDHVTKTSEMIQST